MQRCSEDVKKKGGETKKNEGANEEVGARDFKNQPINDGSGWTVIKNPNTLITVVQGVTVV